MTSLPLVLESIGDLEDHHLKKIFELAKSFKEGSYSIPPSFFPTSPPLIATNFFENSTRTKLSFNVAIKRLGAIAVDLGQEGSSLAKGESLRDTFLTQKAIGVKLAIVRSSNSGELQRFKETPPYPLINAGDGMHQHPTQALIDLFTMKELGLNIQNSTMVIVGDCLHSRKAADWVYQLRVQKERHKVFNNKGFFKEYYEHYGLSLARLKKWDVKPLVFNPGPAAIGTEISTDLIRSDLYMGERQVEHSVPLRMSLIYLMLERLYQQEAL